MIYLDGLNSIIECIYLNEELDDRQGSCDIFVNPSNAKYLIGKVIIINSLDYPIDNIKTLINNKCKIISRVRLKSDNSLEVKPYILRPYFDIMWNGKYIEEDRFNNPDSLFEDDYCTFNLDYKLYFPKVDKLDNISNFLDEEKNLTGIGWALQQVGVNILTNTPFINLDIVKLKKILY